MDRLNRIDLYLNYNSKIEHIDIELEETYKTLEENKVYIKNLETIIDNENVEIERLNNIIKEAREYIESYMPNYDFDKTNLIKLLEILDKEKV